MQIHNLIPNTPEWHAFRFDHDGSSEAAAMLGLSKTTSRTELMRMKITGTAKEFSDWIQKNILDYGHEVEALARPIIEGIIGEELSPVTCSEGRMSASCDGLTFMGNISWEQKQLNKSLIESVKAGILPEEHCPQCYQNLLVTGAEKLIFSVSDGTPENTYTMEVYPDQLWFERIRAGWHQFNIDRANYVPIEIIEKPQADAIMALPAVVINVTGELSICNLSSVTPHFDAFLKGANTSLVTDNDFINGEATAKFSRITAKTLKLKAKEVVDQVASVSEAVRTLELYADKFNKLGLQLENAVKEQKELIKAKILHDATMAFRSHVDSLESETRPIQLNVEKPDFAGVMKNQRMIESLHDKVNTELARVKILADSMAKDIRHKLANMNGEQMKDYAFLFPDLQQIIYKPIDDFNMLVMSRVDKHEKESANKFEVERVRIHTEEETKVRAKIEAEQLAIKQEKAKKPTPASVDDSFDNNQMAQFVITNIFKPTRIQIIESLAIAYSVQYSIAEQWLVEEFTKDKTI